jgi:hypothetical protein
VHQIQLKENLLALWLLGIKIYFLTKIIIVHDNQDLLDPLDFLNDGPHRRGTDEANDVAAIELLRRILERLIVSQH